MSTTTTQININSQERMPQQSLATFHTYDLANKILWHEGLLIAPQHFQLNNLITQNAIAYITSKINPFLFGINNIEIDLQALVSGVFRILKMDGMFQDGLTFSYDISYDKPLEKKIKEYFVTNSQPLKIYLGILKHKVGQNLLSDHYKRFNTFEMYDIGDESADAEKLNVLMLKPNMHLLLANEVDARFLTFPIVEIHKNSSDASVSISKFLPPCLALKKESHILCICREIVFLVRQKIENLASTRANNALYTDFQTQKNIEILIQAILPFEAVINIENLHPFEYYKSLIHAVSLLMSVNTYQVLPQLERYNHNDLYNTFFHLYACIKSILEFLKQMYITIPFNKINDMFVIDLKNKWLERTENDKPNSAKELIISLKKPIHWSDEKFLNWMSGLQICSASFIQQIKSTRILGIERRVMKYDEKLIPAKDCFMIAINIESGYLNSHEQLCIFNTTTNDMADQAVLYIEKE